MHISRVQSSLIPALQTTHWASCEGLLSVCPKSWAQPNSITCGANTTLCTKPVARCDTVMYRNYAFDQNIFLVYFCLCPQFRLTASKTLEFPKPSLVTIFSLLSSVSEISSDP